MGVSTETNEFMSRTTQWVGSKTNAVATLVTRPPSLPGTKD
jgi:hypothetical protein